MSHFLLVLSLGLGVGFSHPDRMHSDLLHEVNTLRAQGCVCGNQVMPPAQQLKWHNMLELSALLHAKQMHRHNFFEHYSLGGKNIGERIRAVGYPWATVGENLARGQKTVHEVVVDWKRSEIHCRVMMHTRFSEVGFARSGSYWVLHLGRRKYPH